MASTKVFSRDIQVFMYFLAPAQESFGISFSQRSWSPPVLNWLDDHCLVLRISLPAWPSRGLDFRVRWDEEGKTNYEDCSVKAAGTWHAFVIHKNDSVHREGPEHHLRMIRRVSALSLQVHEVNHIWSTLLRFPVRKSLVNVTEVIQNFECPSTLQFILGALIIHHLSAGSNILCYNFHVEEKTLLDAQKLVSSSTVCKILENTKSVNLQDVVPSWLHWSFQEQGKVLQSMSHEDYIQLWILSLLHVEPLHNGHEVFHINGDDELTEDDRRRLLEAAKMCRNGVWIQNLARQLLIDERQLLSQVRRSRIQRCDWIPSQLQELVSNQSLYQMDIEQGLLSGTLPCTIVSDGMWKAIEASSREYQDTRQKSEKRLEEMKLRSQQVSLRRAELERELAEIGIEHRELLERIKVQEASLNIIPDLSSFMNFASAVVPIEQNLVNQLTEELRKQEPQLAALDDSSSPQPKLSLLLNSLGVGAPGIEATRTLDLGKFNRRSKRHFHFMSTYQSILSSNQIRDLLYSGEMLREHNYPYLDHEDDCVVCANTTPQQLVNFLRERNIQLDIETVKRENINGKRVLFCSYSQFPDQPREQVEQAIDELLSLHEQSNNSIF